MYFQRWFYIMPICRLFFFLSMLLNIFRKVLGFEWSIFVGGRLWLCSRGLRRSSNFVFCPCTKASTKIENISRVCQTLTAIGYNFCTACIVPRSRRCWLTWSTMRSFLRKKTWPFLGGNLQHAFSATLASMCTWSFATTFIHNAHGRVCMEHVKIEWLACEATYWYIYIYTLTHMYDIYIQYNIKAVLRQ